MTCKRNFSLNEMIEGLKAGRTLCLDRIDAPELEDLQELERQGLVVSKLVCIDDQCSVMKYRWADMVRDDKGSKNG